MADMPPTDGKASGEDIAGFAINDADLAFGGLIDQGARRQVEAQRRVRLHQRRACPGPAEGHHRRAAKRKAYALRISGVIDNAEHLDLPVLHAGDQSVQSVLERTGGNDDNQAFGHVSPHRSGAGVELEAGPRLF